MKIGCPVIGLNDSGGARIQEGVVSLGGYADIFLRNTLASGVVPQISAILGPCAGGAVYSPAITDFVLMVKNTSYMFVTGPNVVKTVTHEEVTSEELGGAMTHATESGVAHFACENEVACLQYDPHAAVASSRPTTMDDPPFIPSPTTSDRRDPALDTIIPENPNKPYDMKEVIEHVVDDGEFLRSARAVRREHHCRVCAAGRARRWASWRISRRCSRACWTSMHPRRGRGSSGSAMRSTFRWSCSKMFPGSCPAPTRSGAGSSPTARSCSTRSARRPFPRITVITRKAYGGAYDVMNSKHIRGDMNFAWPSGGDCRHGAEGCGGDHLQEGN